VYRLLIAASIVLISLAAVGCSSGYHPAGYDDPDVHGTQLKLQQDDCRACHGDNLDGAGSADVSCDSCHADGWRQDCTYCHGGEDTDDGAPPRDLDGTVDEANTSFPPHTVHTTETIHAPYDCTSCHIKPEDAMSVGHIFDSSRGAAEVDFSDGLAAGADWGNQGCSNNYCHGNGQEPGDVELGDTMTCGTCHAPPDVSNEDSSQLSGEHREHIVHDVACFDCHPVVDSAGDIVDAARHVDGEATIALPNGITRDGNGRCTGECHNENHTNEGW